MKGGKQIAQGSYGCVFKPQLLCKGENVRGDGVSKLMETHEAMSEIHEQKKIDEIDPNFKYHLKPPRICDVGDLNPMYDSLSKCRVSQGKYRRDLSILQMEDGGESLEIYLDKVSKSSALKNEETAKKVFFAMENLFAGLVDFYENKFIHFDLKPGNIVYNDSTNRFNFIDFGLASSYDNLDSFFEDREFLLKTGYFITPIEAYMLTIGDKDTSIFQDAAKLKRNASILFNKNTASYRYVNNIESLDDIYYKPFIDNIEKYSEISSINFEELAKKIIGRIDTYSLGICLITFFNAFSSKKYNTKIRTQLTPGSFFRELAHFIEILTNPNFIERGSPREALRHIRKMKEIFDSSLPRSGAAAAAASGSDTTISSRPTLIFGRTKSPITREAHLRYSQITSPSQLKLPTNKPWIRRGGRSKKHKLKHRKNKTGKNKKYKSKTKTGKRKSISKKNSRKSRKHKR